MSEAFDRLGAIVESSDDAIITKTLDGIITSWNRAAARIFGYGANEAIGRHITMLFPRDRLAEEDELVGRIVRGERVDHFETQRIRKDGAVIAVSVTLSPVKDRDGRIVEVSKIARDITARRRLETDMKDAATALASELETTRAFFESAAEGILIVDQAGRIVRVNARGAQLFGYTAGELLGTRVEILLPERFRVAHGEHRAKYFAAPRTRSMGLGLDLFGRRKDGSEFPLEISLSSIQTTQGLLAMALVTDISERRTLEQAARQHEKLAALATLSAGIAHELNNPIAVISTRLELMLEEAKCQALPAGMVDDLHVLHRNIQRVTRIAKGLLSFARQSPDERGPVHVNAVVEETLLLVGKQLGKDGVQVTVNLDPRLAPIWGDTNALQQVLTNLLLNARDAMPRGGRLQIETAAERGSWLRLTVADSGDGMSAEALAKIGEPFYTTKTSGTGLGLTVTYRIVQEHGGTVEVQSEPGRGTVFTVLLPVMPSSPRH